MKKIRTFTRRPLPTKATLIASSLAVAAVTLTGCGAVDTVAREAVQQVDPWEDSLREYLDEEFVGTSDAEMAEACMGLAIMGLDQPEEIGAVLFAFDDAGDLPPASTTMEEFAEQENMPLPLDLPRDLTVREVANEAGAYMLDLCGIDY